MMIKLSARCMISAAAAWSLTKKEKQEWKRCRQAAVFGPLSVSRIYTGTQHCSVAGCCQLTSKMSHNFHCVTQVPGWAMWKISQISVKRPLLGHGSPSTSRTQWVNTATNLKTFPYGLCKMPFKLAVCVLCRLPPMDYHHLIPHSHILSCSMLKCTSKMIRVGIYYFSCEKIICQPNFDNCFVELKINNQTLDSEFGPVSPGEVFKVDRPEDELVKRVMLLPFLWMSDQCWSYS